MKKKITAIDLFAGCGGFSLGARMAGFDVRVAVENNADAAATYHLNHKKTKVLVEDICHITGKKLLQTAGVKKGELGFLFGGPPCQGFTTINQKRSVNDPRSKLMYEFIRMIREIKPKIFMIENVPGLFSFKDFFILLLRILENQGYIVRCLMMDAVSYGVPQYRKRIFIQGVRKNLGFLPSWPAPTHFDPEVKKKFKGKIFPPDAVAIKCFAVNGFPKEEVKDLYWNNVLHIQMNRKTAANVFGNAMRALCFEMIQRK